MFGLPSGQLVLGNEAYILKIKNYNQNLVKGWLQYSLLTEEERDGSDLFRYWDELFMLAIRDPDHAWLYIVRICLEINTPDQIEQLGTGPFEEMLVALKKPLEFKDTQREIEIFRKLAPFAWVGRVRPNIINWIRTLYQN